MIFREIFGLEIYICKVFVWVVLRVIGGGDYIGNKCRGR